MPIIKFPPLHLADEQGLLAFGGNLEAESLIKAYSEGIFPWPIGEEYPMAWFSPDPRGVLYIEDLHIPKSLAKLVRAQKYQITYNKNFEQVIRECQDTSFRKGQTETWITEEIVEAYTNLFDLGYAYSVECWNSEGVLVGGLYGVKINSYFSGESMFYRESNTSKLVLVDLITKLSQMNIPFLDTQMVTSTVENLGGKEIPRKDFIRDVKEMIKKVPENTIF